MERFNGSFRRELLIAHVFRNINEARILAEEWMTDYKNNRPHKALNYLTPVEYGNFGVISCNSNFEWSEKKGSIQSL